jgi:uncharacterized protein DUF29
MTTAITYDWPYLASSSLYETLMAIQEAVRNQEYDEARQGLEELTNAVSRTDRRTVKSHLVRLMAHIIKWKCQPTHRSKSWTLTIDHARDEIRDTQEETPSITDDVIREMWDVCFEKAKRYTEQDTELPADVPVLTWQEVFVDDYSIRK